MSLPQLQSALYCSSNKTNIRQKGFTLIELIVSTVILAILATIAIPNFSFFLAKSRVDNEIAQLHNLLLVARNHAVNLEMPITLCPLNEQQKCHSNWQAELSVFIDLNDNKTFEPGSNETLLRVKPPVSEGDKLQYGLYRKRIKYAPTGRTTGWGSNGTFKYCPKNFNSLARGIVIATSGRLYLSDDIDDDGKHENRSGVEIQCRS